MTCCARPPIKKPVVGTRDTVRAALTGLVSILVFIAPFSPAQEECNQCVNTSFTRPINDIEKSSTDADADDGSQFLPRLRRRPGAICIEEPRKLDRKRGSKDASIVFEVGCVIGRCLVRMLDVCFDKFPLYTTR